MNRKRHNPTENKIGFSVENRFALVIGNSKYSKGPLINPAHDSEDMADLLENLGFEVQLLQDANGLDMEQAVDEFAKNLSREAVGLFYYAGHSIQADGLNYLIPVDARIDKQLHVRFKAVNVAFVLASMEEARSRVNIVILDACRDNPFANTRSGFGRGLAPIIGAPKGTFIAYSTAPGQTAEDGYSRNSPYTEELLKYIPKEGWEIETTMKQVRSSVMEKTNQRQVPWESTSLIGEFYFHPRSTKKTGTQISIFRSQPEMVTDTQAKKMIEKYGIFDVNWNKLSEGIKHEYYLIQQGTIVSDKMTNLIWQQSGSDNHMSFNDAEVFIAKINQEKYGGFDDWRLPTLEEAMSLMENHRKNGDLHIHPMFDKKQRWIWTADFASADMAWFVHFLDGLCSRNQMRGSKYFVRAVRNGQL